MPSADPKTIKRITALTEVERRDLFSFLEASSGANGEKDLDEANHILQLLALSAKRKSDA